MSTVVRLENVRKKFGREVALDGVSLEIASGTICALLGDNGAGKSTTLRIALGLLEPDGGTAETLGLDVRAYGGDIRRRIGYVPERPALYEWMTIAEIGWFTAGFHPPAFADRFGALCKRFELPPRKRLRDLSKGTRAKVSLALALAPEPELLILDEPTSGLDPVVRREFLESMAEVAAEGRTVLLSSHQLNEVERVADRIVIVRRGKFVFDAEVAGLKEEAAELVVTFADGGDYDRLLSNVAEKVLRRNNGVRQSRLLLLGPKPGLIDELYAHSAVRDVQLHPLTLEEMYLSFMKPEETSTASTDRIPTPVGG